MKEEKMHLKTFWIQEKWNSHCTIDEKKVLFSPRRFNQLDLNLSQITQ